MKVRLHDDTSTYTGARAQNQATVIRKSFTTASRNSFTSTDDPLQAAAAASSSVAQNDVMSALHSADETNGSATATGRKLSMTRSEPVLDDKEANPDKSFAAIKLQRIQRGHLARQESKNQREVRHLQYLQSTM